MNFSRRTTEGAAATLTYPAKLHTVSISPLTATPTAGLLSIYDSATEAGTVIYSEWVFATTPGHTITLDCDIGAGIYIGFDATLANVAVTVTWQ
jgi:hypothetical protein